MLPVFELPVLTDLDGIPFNVNAALSDPAEDCNKGCSSGCRSGCDVGGGVN